MHFRRAKFIRLAVHAVNCVPAAPVAQFHNCAKLCCQTLFMSRRLLALQKRFVTLTALVLTGCAAEVREVAPPVTLNQTQVLGVESSRVRFWGDEIPQDLERIAAKTRAKREAAIAAGLAPKRGNLENILVISGGGSDGAFGAGLLNGWTKSGKRPKFNVVTGVSTGALIAPFAFLGSNKDHLLREFYTTHSTKDIVRPTVVQGLFGGAALTSSAPLAALIAKYIDRDTFRRIAEEHKRGRYLLVGTTNLDAQRSVIWDMGEIASIGTDSALQLFRKVILASASIGGAFPPVKINVIVDGKLRQELHVDGGTTDNIVLVPVQVNLSVFDKGRKKKPKRRLYVLVNSHLNPEWEATKGSAIDIATRSISTLIKQQTIGDVRKLYDFAKTNKIDFNLATIPASFKTKSKEAFDKTYMTELFRFGEKLGQDGFNWSKKPVYQ